MNPILEEKKNAIVDLCRKYGVVKLELFGSANTPEFDPDRSDFDFILELESGDDIFVRYMRFTEALESLLGRKTDFVSESKLHPRFLESIAPTREIIFASKKQTIAA